MLQDGVPDHCYSLPAVLHLGGLRYLYYYNRAPVDVCKLVMYIAGLLQHSVMKLLITKLYMMVRLKRLACHRGSTKRGRSGSWW